MTKSQGTLRTYPAGAVVVGTTVTFKKHVDNTTITTDSTDASGQWQYEANGSPGPWYWTATDTAPTPDVIRVGSSKSYGSGGAYALYELVHALRVLGNGVIRDYLNGLAITDSAVPTANTLNYATGGVVAKGIPAIFSTAGTYLVTGDVSTDVANTKACYLVVDVTGAGQTEEGKAVLKAVCGAAAASPALPSLTQTEATYQVPLCTFVLGVTGATAANSITAVTDARSYLLTRNPVVSSVVRRSDPTAEITTVSTTGADATSLTTTVSLLSGVIYDIEARATLSAKISSAAETVSIAPYIDGTSNMATFVASNTTSYALLSNTYTLEGVVGAGTTINCGLRWKISNAAATGTANTGVLTIIARPRS